jgi:DNA primase
LDKGNKLSNLVSLGLSKEKNQKYYDVFRNRLMFPIINHRGESIGFGGRLLEDNPEMPKYLNSPETPVYRKGDTLYGLYITQKYVRESGYAVVVEGYMDLLSLYAAGIKNVVATLGTSFTEKQVALIKRYAERVVMFYDGDEPGKKAAMRSLPTLLQGKLQVDAYFLENELDPDEAVKELGVDKLQKELKSSKPLLGYLMDSKLIYGLPLNETMKATNEILSYVALIPDKLTQRHWINELSLRSKIKVSELNDTISTMIKPDRYSPQPVNAKIRPKGKIDPLCKNLVRVVFLKPELADSVFDEEHDFYLPQDIRLLLHKIKEYVNQNKSLSVSDWIAISKEIGIDWVSDILSAEVLANNSDERNITKEFHGCLLQFNIRYLENKRTETQSRIRGGENSEIAMKEIATLTREINNLKQHGVSLDIQEVTR